MDKNAIKKYAVWARNELIARVAQKALQYGITEENIVAAGADSINGKLLTDIEKKQRQALIAQIKDKGFEQVMEEVAYTWFNRFSALRFMEVNGYLPTHVRVFTDEENNFKPQIITEAIHLEMDGLDMEKVYVFKDADKTEELYKYLLITQCNALNKILPRMFQKISDYTELLFPDNLLREGSVIEQMIALIPENDWKDAVQIIGWMYQYYNSEKKDEVFAALKKNVKITKENIPAATQLFTPDWIVRYMVENSLGRLWLEGHPNEELKSEWKYYLDEAEQEVEVQTQLSEIRKEYASITPEQIKCIDPCCGSGHICAYMFDVLMKIYEAYGYTTNEAVRSIVENNLYGLDIDERAAQLAYFAVMMKARQYDRRFLIRKDEAGNPDVPQPHVYAICESNGIDVYALDYFVNGDSKLKSAMDSIIEEMHDAKEYGSILNITPVDFNALYARFNEVCDDISMSRETVLSDIFPLVRVAEVMSQKYEAVVTNPPYMGTKGMNSGISDYLAKHYPESKADLFAAFIEKSLSFASCKGYVSLITQRTWLYINAFEKMRVSLLQNALPLSFVELGAGAFEDLAGEVVQSVSFVISKQFIDSYKSVYLDLTQGDDKMTSFFSAQTQSVVTSTFKSIPGYTFAMKLSSNAVMAYKDGYVSRISIPRKGLISSDNNRFLRLWHEVAIGRIQFGMKSITEQREDTMWTPHNKGGAFRKWYGNQDYVINWANNGSEVKAYAAQLYKSYSRQIMNEQYYFLKSISWSSISSHKIGVRIYPQGFTFDTAGPSMFISDDIERNTILGLLGCVVSEYYIKGTNPTINLLASDIANLPLPQIKKQEKEEINRIVLSNIEIAKKDWDSYETSWDFRKHPLVPTAHEWIEQRNSQFASTKVEKFSQLAWHYEQWESACKYRFDLLKENEEELNRIFIDIYGLQDELTSEVADDDVTVRLADKKRDVKSLISYAVGCIFGRYSLDVEGIAHAGGEWDDSKYVTFNVNKGNIIPICDDEYFSDDIVGRFVSFVEIVYGKEARDENLRFIAEALGGNGQPLDVIRNYFLNDFYTDHLKIYQKRPIYWLFDSGKKNGFKALVYMHRYAPDTIARMRTDYVHEQQSRYRTAIADIEQRVESATTSERVKLNKKLKTLQEQAIEIQGYEEKIHHLADQYITIDLDDGVKKNYEIFKDVLAKIK